MTTDKIVSSHYEDPLLNMQGISLYQRHPEHSEWTQYEIRERADGSRYRMTRSAYRWNSQFSYGDWKLDSGWVPPKTIKVCFAERSETSREAGPPKAVRFALCWAALRSYQWTCDECPTFCAEIEAVMDAAT